jgi:hypothetical protein
MTIQWSLLNAGALAVVLITFVDGVPMLSDIVTAFRHPPNDCQFNHDAMSYISLSSIPPEASDLLHTVWTPASYNPGYLPSGDALVCLSRMLYWDPAEA